MATVAPPAETSAVATNGKRVETIAPNDSAADSPALDDASDPRAGEAAT